MSKVEQVNVVTIIFYRHWYKDEYEYPKCSQWQDLDWYEYLAGWHRNSLDMGDDNPITLLHTEINEFLYNKETGNVIK